MKKKTKLRIRRWISILSMTGFAVCVVTLLYPVISDRWNRYRDSQLITEYNQVIEQTDDSVYEEVFQKAAAYNRQLLSQHRNIVTDAAYDPDEYYETLLNITGNGMMCYVEIPKIDVTEPVYHYSTEISLGKGVGHIHGSSLPIGGENTHTILTGHRGLPNQKFFSDLDRITIGDRFYIHIMKETLAYEVYQRQIIEPSDVSGLMIENGKDLATLVTCEPYGVNTHRLVLTGKRVDFDQANVKDGYVTVEKHETIIDPAVWVAAGFLLFLICMVSFTVGRKIHTRISKRRHPSQTGDDTPPDLPMNRTSPDDHEARGKQQDNK